MWWETNARRSLATQKVFFSSAPVASTGRGNAQGRRTGSGAKPRERRTRKTRSRKERTTESSVRMWMARSWSRKQSAMASSRSKASSSADAIGSSEMLPLVRTKGTARSRARRWCRGV